MQGVVDGQPPRGGLHFPESLRVGSDVLCDGVTDGRASSLLVISENRGSLEALSGLTLLKTPNLIVPVSNDA